MQPFQSDFRSWHGVILHIISIEKWLTKNRHSKFIAYIRTSAAHIQFICTFEVDSSKMFNEKCGKWLQNATVSNNGHIGKTTIPTMCSMYVEMRVRYRFRWHFLQTVEIHIIYFRSFFTEKNMNDSIFVIISHASENRRHRMAGHFLYKWSSLSLYFAIRSHITAILQQRMTSQFTANGCHYASGKPFIYIV